MPGLQILCSCLNCAAFLMLDHCRAANQRLKIPSLHRPCDLCRKIRKSFYFSIEFKSRCS